MPRRRAVPLHETETVPLDQLRPHPRNYRDHPDEQREHIAASLRDHGVYRNVVVANDYTVLAGHGVVQAAAELGIKELPVVRLPVEPDSPEAIQVLTADNELGRFANSDDRQLAGLLKELHDADRLFGTGYDDAQLAALLMVTRSRAEIEDFDAAAEWVGMPDYIPAGKATMMLIQFEDEAGRSEFIERNGLRPTQKSGRLTAWWPAREVDDRVSVKWESEAG